LAEDVVGSREPGQSVVDVLLLELIRRGDRFYDVSDERGGGLYGARRHPQAPTDQFAGADRPSNHDLMD